MLLVCMLLKYVIKVNYMKNQIFSQFYICQDGTPILNVSHLFLLLLSMLNTNWQFFHPPELSRGTLLQRSSQYL